MLATAGPGRLHAVGEPRDPVQRPGGGDSRWDVRGHHVRRRLRARRSRSDAGDRVRRRAAADVRRPARLLAPPAGDVHQRLLPRGHRVRAWTTTRSRSPRSTSRGRCSPASWRSRSGTRPRWWTSSSSSAGRTCSARWAAIRGSAGSRRTLNVGHGLLREPGPGGRVGPADRRARRARHEAGFDASDQMPPEVGSGSFWTGMIAVHAAGTGFPPGDPRRDRGELARRVDGSGAVRDECDGGSDREAVAPSTIDEGGRLVGASSGDGAEALTGAPPTGGRAIWIFLLRLATALAIPIVAIRPAVGCRSTSSATRTRTACSSWAWRSSSASAASSSCTGR